MPLDLRKTELIVLLLQQITSLHVVSEFLKSKGERHSAGSWDDMLKKRIIPSVESHAVTNSELIELLRLVEECGRQHIFLFACPVETAIELLDRERISSVLRSIGLDHLLIEPIVLDQPEEPTIVDVRWDTATVDLSVTVKEIEQRKYQKFSGTETHGTTIHKLYDLVKERAVNVAKLHRTGLFEIRISSHSNTNRYAEDINRFWNKVSEIFPVRHFSELSLSVAKDRLWAERATLGNMIRYSDSTLRDEQGNVLRAATGSDSGDLVSNTAVAQSLDYLLAHDSSAYCDGANFWFKERPGLSSETRVLLAGDNHEFALPSNCNAEDYKYVLDQLRSFNQPVS